MMRLMWYSVNLPGRPLRNTCGETISSIPFFQEDQTERELNAANDGLGEQFGELVDHPGQREHQEQGAEDDAEAPITDSVIIAG